MCENHEAFFEEMKSLLKERLSAYRFEHSLNVAAEAKRLAHIYGVDEQVAEITGLLHDWDKGYNDAEIQERCKELGIEVDSFSFNSMPKLLHGVTAAKYFRTAYPEISEEVLQAIERHTSGAIDMTDLDMIIYIADVIEPGRNYPATKDLREMVGKIDLEALYLKTFKQVFARLIETEASIHPDTVRVWNYYIGRAKQKKEKRAVRDRD